MPSVVVINECAQVSGRDLRAMTAAFETQWNRDLAPAWGVEPAAFAVLEGAAAPAAEAWWLVFLEDQEQARALGYHDLTEAGLPLAKVFVGALGAAGVGLSVGASHEVCEMAVDPRINSAFQDPAGVFWAGEACDPVADDRYAYPIDGVLVSDFVTPAWFGAGELAPRGSPGRLDLGGHVAAPFQILPGGFAHRFEPPRGWTPIAAAAERPVARGAISLRCARLERRVRQAAGPLRPSRRFRGPA